MTENSVRPSEGLSYREEFAPYGFRKMIAMLIIFSATMLPPLHRWWNAADGSAQVEDSGSDDTYLPGTAPHTRLIGSLGRLINRMATIIAAIFGLALYYPRRGFKRYSLVCGPLIALLVPKGVEMYLAGRSEVYRLEVALVTVVSAAPGVLLYVFLTWRKARKQGMVW